MDYQINNFTFDFSGSNEGSGTNKLEADLFLQRERRKIIFGTVRFPDGRPAPNAVIIFFKSKPHGSSENLELIGHTIADDSGEFLLGPFFPDEKIILKIGYMDNYISDPVKSTCEPGSI